MTAQTHSITAAVILISLAGLFLCSMKVKAEDKQEEKVLKERLNSMQQLRKLGDMLNVYAESHDGKFPVRLNEVKIYNDTNMVWIINNISYIGANTAQNILPPNPVAFDNTMISLGNGTVVLFNDGHVEFVKPDNLAKLGIPKSFEEPPAEKQKKNTSLIVLRVAGLDGEALSEARVYKHFSISNGRQNGKEYVCDGNGWVNLPEDKIFEYEGEKGVLLYGLYKDKLAGFQDVYIDGPTNLIDRRKNATTDDLNKKWGMILTPVCRVHGNIKSTELETLEQKLDWTNVCVWRDRDRPLSYMSQKGGFEFFLPEGAYKLDAYGLRTYDEHEDIKVKAGQKDLEINFDLPADRLAYLIGKEAPELQKIKGWINSKPLTLAKLRGKVVLLDFWGTWCGPCVYAIPKLIDLHEKYHDKGLVVIGIHDDSMNSVKDLEKEINKLSKERWDGREIPFAIALDGGGRCKIEGTNLTSSGATTSAYGIQAFPTMVLIDKQGKVISDFYPGPNNELLERLLAD